MDSFTITLTSSVTLAGFHHWPNAPTHLSYLRNEHRHLFAIDLDYGVRTDDREREFIEVSNELREYLQTQFGEPMQLGPMSCEHLAIDILEAFPFASACSVFEDGENGASVSR